jgi:hypothetical protein
MRFLGYTLASETEMPTEPPSPDLYEQMGRFVEEATKAGVIVATGGLAPTAAGARISLKGGEYTVVDGPFAEAKELVGGWALMECRDLPEAGQERTLLSERARASCSLSPASGRS